MDSFDFDIELLDEEQDEVDSVQLPLNFLTFGELESDDVKIYIKQDVFKALEKLAASDTSKELGSILLGEYCEELGKTHVIISDYIEAKYTDASASTLTFTHETWEYVHKEHEANFADRKIIGWQHTHPNYGIFLSNYDMFIQENFFNMPFQVAYVIDPIQNLRGFFQWKNGKVEKLKGYYIYDEVGKPIKIDPQKPKTEKTESNNTSIGASKMMIAMTSVLCVICAVLAVSLISLNSTYQKKLDKQTETINNIATLLTEQMVINDEQATEIASWQETFVNGLLDDKATAQDLIDKLEATPNRTQTQETLLAELKAFVAQQEDATVQFMSYTVQEGDSLYSICEDNGLDYSADHAMLLAVNGITDPNAIYVGQTLLIPVL